MADATYHNWSIVPDHILVEIFRPLSFRDRFVSAQVCRSWSSAFNTASLWRKFTVSFNSHEDKRYLTLAKKYHMILRDLTINVDPIQEENRLHACKFLQVLLNECDDNGGKNEGIVHFKMEFVGTNPLFYTGKEVVDSLKMLFSSIHTLKSVDLGGLNVLLDTELVDILSENNRLLERLNLENKTIISKIYPPCMQRLAERCLDLRELVVFYSSLDNNVLVALVGCANLKRLSIMSRRSEKFGIDIECQYWKTLAEKLPDLRVCLKFDSTCPVNIINAIFKPDIPVDDLRLEIYCHVHEQLNCAVAFYAATLETLVVNTPSLREFNEALLNAVRECRRLHTLLIYCRLPPEVINEILDIRPDIRERGSYVLKSRADPEDLWVVGREFDEM